MLIYALTICKVCYIMRLKTLQIVKGGEIILRDWLKQKREEKGFTMKQMGEKLGISESYYFAIENGTRQKKMDLVLVSALSAALDMPITEIAAHES